MSSPAEPILSGDLIDVLAVTARRAACAGAAVADGWRSNIERIDAREKADHRDLVCRADHDTERAVRAVLEELRPDDAVLGEELGPAAGSSGLEWLVDPIDGTTNYLKGRSAWATSVAVRHAIGGDVLAGAIAGPAAGLSVEARFGGGAWCGGRRLQLAGDGDLSRALVELNLGRAQQRDLAGQVVGALAPRVRDLRQGGSAAVALASVARGQVDAYWGPGLQPWDGAAGILIAHEAGALVGDLSGELGPRWPDSGDLLVATPGLWAELRSILATLDWAGRPRSSAQAIATKVSESVAAPGGV